MSYFKTGNTLNVKNTESVEERMFRMSAIHNEIFYEIDAIKNGRDILRIQNKIKDYEKEAGENSTEVFKLKKKLAEQIETITTDLDSKINALNEEIYQFKSQTYTEPIEIIREINERAEIKMYQIMLELGRTKQNDTNRRKIGNFVVSADRVTATALSRLCSLPQYENLFTEKQRKIIAERIQSPAEIVFKKNINTKITEKSKQLAKYYMLAFGIRSVLKQIANEENAYYFKAE